MDQGMDRGVWILCGPGALIHTLHFDSYPYGYDQVLRGQSGCLDATVSEAPIVCPRDFNWSHPPRFPQQNYSEIGKQK